MSVMSNRPSIVDVAHRVAADRTIAAGASRAAFHDPTDR
jgi:hypothetical protein